MGNVLRSPTLGAITPNFPHVMTDQLVGKPSKPKASKLAAVTMTSESNENIAYYAVIVAAAVYFLKGG